MHVLQSIRGHSPVDDILQSFMMIQYTLLPPKLLTLINTLYNSNKYLFILTSNTVFIHYLIKSSSPRQNDNTNK